MQMGAMRTGEIAVGREGGARRQKARVTRGQVSGSNPRYFTRTVIPTVKLRLGTIVPVIVQRTCVTQ
jgi:hypothetical protein